MRILQQNCKMHIFICTNQREKTKGMPCCADVHGQEIYDEIKNYVKQEGLTDIVWVTRTRCLGFCNAQGATIVIYPQKIWLTEVVREDIAKIKMIINDYK